MMNTLSETVRIKVRFSEVDSIQMVWHGNYVQYLEDAREAWGRKYGLEYMHIYRSGYLAPMYDLKLQYKQTATIDDVLIVSITYRPERGAKLIFDYEIHRETDHALILTATTTQLFTTQDGVLEPSCPSFLKEWKEKNHVVC
ncbi:MAG: acyl-CoA thioesterase [Mediterranea massiliensis]|nr:acyl-CoA thioesterase [Mediterranea massiliensis]